MNRPGKMPLLWGVTRVNNVTVLKLARKALVAVRYFTNLSLESNSGLENDETERLWMPGCVHIFNRDEDTAEVVPARFHPVFHPKLSDGTLGVG